MFASSLGKKAPLVCVAAGWSTIVACATMNPPRGADAWREVPGTPVIWKDPGNVGARDLYWGIGSADRAPQTPFTFVSENTTGTNPKVTVTDAKGTTWSVKFAGTRPHKNEVHAEVAATRLTWGLGYLVEENYFVAEGTIGGIGTLGRAAASVQPNGAFQLARFERQSPDMKASGHTWSFAANPFAGTKELSGLMILSSLLNHWDLKYDNTAIVQVTPPGGSAEAWFLFADFGSTFGKMGGLPRMFSGRNRWSLVDYQRQPFIEGVRDGRVFLNYSGTAKIEDVPLEHARWFASLLSPLSSAQVRRAFEAAGAPAAEADGFTARVLQKISQLQSAVR